MLIRKGGVTEDVKQYESLGMVNQQPQGYHVPEENMPYGNGH